MAWTADQIYTIPNPDLIKYLQNIEYFAGELFLVNDLEGIRFDWIRDFMLSEEVNKDSFRKHGIPEKGLLVIKPVIYRTGYDTDEESLEFWKNYKSNYKDKWGFVCSIETEQVSLNESLNLNKDQRKLIRFLKTLSIKFKIPFCYYHCVMWGGDIEEEVAVVIEEQVSVYAYDCEEAKYYQYLDNNKVELTSSALQIGVSAVGVHLPTWFFALHEGSFDWRRYRISAKGAL